LLVSLAAVALLHNTIHWQDLAALAAVWAELFAPVIERLAASVGPADILVCMLYLAYARYTQLKLAAHS
jgi:hypothetical protein